MKVALQFALDDKRIPSDKTIIGWARAALAKAQGEVTVRVVDSEEIQELNYFYRRKNHPTNVLSFPFDDCDEILGDIIICLPVIISEARTQKKTITAHFAHIVVHGCLHLLGFDHKTADEANKMEAEEIRILRSLGICNPYESFH